MDYSKLNDCEIAHMVAQKLPGRYITYPDHVMDSETEEKFDPCNNPADAWPIIYENGITIARDDNYWVAGFYDDPDGYSAAIYGNVNHANPLRAAMVVFLMMQERQCLA